MRYLVILGLIALVSCRNKSDQDTLLKQCIKNQEDLCSEISLADTILFHGAKNSEDYNPKTDSLLQLSKKYFRPLLENIDSSLTAIRKNESVHLNGKSISIINGMSKALHDTISGLYKKIDSKENYYEALTQSFYLYPELHECGKTINDIIGLTNLKSRVLLVQQRVFRNIAGSGQTTKCMAIVPVVLDDKSVFRAHEIYSAHALLMESKYLYKMKISYIFKNKHKEQSFENGTGLITFKIDEPGEYTYSGKITAIDPASGKPFEYEFKKSFYAIK
jgi:hypothetical protein